MSERLVLFGKPQSSFYYVGDSTWDPQRTERSNLP
jgi:hypothetical protein